MFASEPGTDWYLFDLLQVKLLDQRYCYGVPSTMHTFVLDLIKIFHIDCPTLGRPWTLSQQAEVVFDKISGYRNKTYTGLISMLQGFQ